MAEETRPLVPGDIIHGFAYGASDRDHYGCARIEAVGPDWIVARTKDGGCAGLRFASGSQELKLCLQFRDSSSDEPCPLEDDEPLLTGWRYIP